ncbi:MAG: tautomerase family protein [Kiloniellales bacterium]
MPMIDVHVIKGVFSAEQKRDMIEKITDTMVDIEGESLREVTWVRIREINSGEWGIGGRPFSTDDMKALQGIAG